MKNVEDGDLYSGYQHHLNGIIPKGWFVFVDFLCCVRES